MASAPHALRVALTVLAIDIAWSLATAASGFVGVYQPYGAWSHIVWSWLHYPASWLLALATAPPPVVELNPSPRWLKVVITLAAYGLCWLQLVTIAVLGTLVFHKVKTAKAQEA
jgi:hypothetical protein